MGIRDDAVRSRLLRETTLDLQKTIDICRAAEQSKSHLDAIESEALLQGVQAVKKIEGRSKRTERPQDKQTKSAKIMVDCKYCGLSHEKDKVQRLGKRVSRVEKRIILPKCATAEATVTIAKHI